MKWEKVKLGDYVKLTTGKTPPTSQSQYFEGDVLWVTPSDFKSKLITETSRTLTNKAIEDKKCNHLPPNTVLLSCIGDIGKVGILKNGGTTNQQITALIPSKNLDSDYLYYCLLNSRTELNSLANNAVVPILNNARLNTLDIPLPPLSTQQRIADILDKADALRRKDKALLKKYDALAQAIFMNMFGDPVKNEKGWEVRKLGEVCTKITDGTHFSPPSQAEGIPYITAKHVKKGKVDFYSNPTYVSEEHHKEIYLRCTPVKGDVLYIKDGATTGIAAVNEYDFAFSMLSSLALIKPNIKILNSYYLVAWLNNEKVKEDYIRNYMAGAAIRRFTLDKLKRFELFVPPIELQNSFEIIVKNLFEQSQIVFGKQSETLFHSLLQSAFEGDLL